MELQFQKSTCKFLECLIREIQNAELTQEIRLSDGMPDIGRVLASWGQVILRGKEWRGDMAMLSGGLMVWVLYAPEDGSDPKSVEGWLPFQLKWNLPATDRDGVLRISPVLRFVDSRNVSARKIMVRAGIAALGEALCAAQTPVYNSGELPDDVQLLTRTYPVRLPREAGEKTFFVDEDISMPASSGAEKILSYSALPQLQDKKVMSDKVVLRGSTELHLIYRDQNGKIRSWDTSVPFAQYGDLDTAYGPEAQADVQMGITSLELDLNDQGQLRFKCGLLAQYLVDDRELLTLGEDAYSLRRDVQPMNEPLMVPGILEKRTETVPVRHTLAGQSGEVMDMVFLPDQPRLRKTDEGVEAQLSGIFQILCSGEDGILRSGTSRWESTFAFPADPETLVTMLSVPAVSGRARTEGEDMLLETQLELSICTQGENGIPMIAGLEIGEEKEPEVGRPSVILRRPEGRSLWELAKASGSTVAAIQNANQLQEEPADNRMLLIPVC